MSSSENKEQGSSAKRPSLEDELERLSYDVIQSIAARWWKIHLKPSGWGSFNSKLEYWGFVPAQYLEAGLTIEYVRQRGTRGVHYSEGHLELFCMVYQNSRLQSYGGDTNNSIIEDYDGPEFFENDFFLRSASTPIAPAAVPPLLVVEQQKSSVEPAKKRPALVHATISAPEESRSPVQPTSKKTRVEKFEANPQSTRGPLAGTSSVAVSNWSHPRDAHMELLRGMSQRPQPLVAVGRGDLELPSGNRVNQNEQSTRTASGGIYQQNRENTTPGTRIKFLEDTVLGIGYDTTTKEIPVKRIANLEEEILAVAPETKAPPIKRIEILEANAKKLADCVKKLEHDWEIVFVDITPPVPLKERIKILERDTVGEIRSGMRLVKRISLLLCEDA
jgi:hypothetical protein